MSTHVRSSIYYTKGAQFAYTLSITKNKPESHKSQATSQKSQVKSHKKKNTKVELIIINP